MQVVLNPVFASLLDVKGARMVRQEVLHEELQKVGMTDIKTFCMWHVEGSCMSAPRLSCAPSRSSMTTVAGSLYIVRVSPRNSSVRRKCIPSQFRDKELHSRARFPVRICNIDVFLCLCRFDVVVR